MKTVLDGVKLLFIFTCKVYSNLSLQEEGLKLSVLKGNEVVEFAHFPHFLELLKWDALNAWVSLLFESKELEGFFSVLSLSDRVETVGITQLQGSIDFGLSPVLF